MRLTKNFDDLCCLFNHEPPSLKIKEVVVNYETKTALKEELPKDPTYPLGSEGKT